MDPLKHLSKEKISFVNRTLGFRKSFLNQTYVLKFLLLQQSFLNQDSFLIRSFLNQDLYVPILWPSGHFTQLGFEFEFIYPLYPQWSIEFYTLKAQLDPQSWINPKSDLV